MVWSLKIIPEIGDFWLTLVKKFLELILVFFVDFLGRWQSSVLLISHLLKLFNASFNQWVYPKSLRRAKLFPLTKVFRASCIILFNLLEKLYYVQKTSFICRLIDFIKTGFRSFSSETAFERKMVSLFFFDFRKAFDTITI